MTDYKYTHIDKAINWDAPETELRAEKFNNSLEGDAHNWDTGEVKAGVVKDVLLKYSGTGSHGTCLWYPEWDKVVSEIDALYQKALEDAVRAEAQKIGEALCIVVGNQMLASEKAGQLLGDQLRDIFKLCQSDAGIVFEVAP